MTCGFLIQLVFKEKKTMWSIGVEVEQETSGPPPKKNPGSAPDSLVLLILFCYYRHVAIKEITLDPNKKNRTKEAVLKEARYCIVVFKLACHHLSQRCQPLEI